MAIFRLSAILRKRDKLFDELWFNFGGLELSGETFSKFIDTILQFMPPNVDRKTINLSVLENVGKSLTKEEMFNLSWRLAGNLDSLNTGIAVPSWINQITDEWVPVQIINSEPYRNRYNDKGHLFDFRIMAGTSCPQIITKFWSNRFCHYIAKQLGFTNSYGEMPLLDGSEFVSMRLQVLIEAERSYEYPVFDKVHTTQSCINWNRKILKLRKRLSAPCPNDFTHECYRCFVGYSDCPAGTHSETYEKKYCTSCNQMAYTDTMKDTAICINCANKFNLRLKAAK